MKNAPNFTRVVSYVATLSYYCWNTREKIKFIQLCDDSCYVTLLPKLPWFKLEQEMLAIHCTTCVQYAIQISDVLSLRLKIPDFLIQWTQCSSLFKCANQWCRQHQSRKWFLLSVTEKIKNINVKIDNNKFNICVAIFCHFFKVSFWLKTPQMTKCLKNKKKQILALEELSLHHLTPNLVFMFLFSIKKNKKSLIISVPLFLHILLQVTIYS